MLDWQNKIRNQGRVLGEMPSHEKKEPEDLGLLEGNQLLAFISASLGDDLASLKGMASIDRKIEFKKNHLIPKYAEYIKRLKKSGLKHEILGFYLVWLFDAGEIGQALEMGDWCLENNQGLPDIFKSDIHFFIASQAIKWSEETFDAGGVIEPYFSSVFIEIEEEKEKWNLPDELTARFYRLKGLEAEVNEDWTLMQESLEKAFALGAQVKTKLDQVNRRLEKNN